MVAAGLLGLGHTTAGPERVEQCRAPAHRARCAGLGCDPLLALLCYVRPVNYAAQQQTVSAGSLVSCMRRMLLLCPALPHTTTLCFAGELQDSSSRIAAMRAPSSHGCFAVVVTHAVLPCRVLLCCADDL